VIHFLAFPVHHDAAPQRTLFLIVERNANRSRRGTLLRRCSGRCYRVPPRCYPRCYPADICAVPRPAKPRPSYCSRSLILESFDEMAAVKNVMC
jgi:hypothetical protein